MPQNCEMQSCQWYQARSHEFAMGGGVFWRLETTSNDLDPDFGWSSNRLSHFFVQIYVISVQKKRSSARLKPSFSGRNHSRFLTNSHRQCQWGVFSFLVQKSASKVLKRVCILFRPMWGGYSPPPTFPWLRY